MLKKRGKCKREEGSWLRTACTLPRNGVTIQCVATRCVPSGFSGNTRALSQLIGKYTGDTDGDK